MQEGIVPISNSMDTYNPWQDFLNFLKMGIVLNVLGRGELKV
jgi:hypothetical protein